MDLGSSRFSNIWSPPSAVVCKSCPSPGTPAPRPKAGSAGSSPIRTRPSTGEDQHTIGITRAPSAIRRGFTRATTPTTMCSGPPSPSLTCHARAVMGAARSMYVGPAVIARVRSPITVSSSSCVAPVSVPGDSCPAKPQPSGSPTPHSPTSWMFARAVTHVARRFTKITLVARACSTRMYPRSSSRPCISMMARFVRRSTNMDPFYRARCTAPE